MHVALYLFDSLNNQLLKYMLPIGKVECVRHLQLRQYFSQILLFIIITQQKLNGIEVYVLFTWNDFY